MTSTPERTAAMPNLDPSDAVGLAIDAAVQRDALITRRERADRESAAQAATGLYLGASLPAALAGALADPDRWGRESGHAPPLVARQSTLDGDLLYGFYPSRFEELGPGVLTVRCLDDPTVNVGRGFRDGRWRVVRELADVGDLVRSGILTVIGPDGTEHPAQDVLARRLLAAAERQRDQPRSSVPPDTIVRGQFRGDPNVHYAGRIVGYGVAELREGTAPRVHIPEGERGLLTARDFARKLLPEPGRTVRVVVIVEAADADQA